MIDPTEEVEVRELPPYVPPVVAPPEESPPDRDTSNDIIVPPEVPPMQYDVIYPLPLDENMNVVWDEERKAEHAAANKPIFEQIARRERNSLLTTYDKLVGSATRAIRLAGPQDTAGVVSELYEYIDELDAYAILLQDVPDQVGFPEEIVWPVLPTAPAVLAK